MVVTSLSLPLDLLVPMAIMMMFMGIMVSVVLAMPVLFSGHVYIQRCTAHDSMWPAALFVFLRSIRRISCFSHHGALQGISINLVQV